MNKPVLIVATGSPPPEMNASFHQWFGRCMPGVSVENSQVDQGAALPENLDGFSGAIVTGSASMVSERLDWSEHTADWLRRQFAAPGIPILGVCYGHQLIAHALGGTIAFHPDGREMGTFEVQVTHGDDPLLVDLPDTLTVQLSHQQAVLELPEGARILARNDHSPHQMVRFGPSLWGVQFHPEFDAAIMARYIALRADNLRSEGLDPNALRANIKESDHGPRLLANFARLCHSLESITSLQSLPDA